MPVRSLLLLALICLVWAANIVVSKLVIVGLHVPPVWFAAMRAGVVTLVLLPWLRPWPRPFVRAVGAALLISGGSFALLFTGLRTASPAAAAVVGLAGAPLTVLFAILMLGEQVGWRRIVGMAMSVLGVGTALVSPSALQASFGLILVGASAVTGALGSVMLKQVALSAVRMQAWAGLSSVILLVPLSLASEHGQAAATLAGGWPLAAGLGFSALIVSVGAHTAYFHLLQRHDANLIAPLTLMTPVFTILLGVWLTHDPVGPQLLIGGLVAAAGVLVILLRPSAKLFKPLLVRTRI